MARGVRERVQDEDEERQVLLLLFVSPYPFCIKVTGSDRNLQPDWQSI